MDSWHIIVCEFCSSYRTEETDWQRGHIEYRCNACGIEFAFSEYDEYVKRNPPNPKRCSECDEVAMELIDNKYRYEGQADEEETELHQCKNCGQQVIFITKEDPGVMYD